MPNAELAVIAFDDTGFPDVQEDYDDALPTLQPVSINSVRSYSSDGVPRPGGRVAALRILNPNNQASPIAPIDDNHFVMPFGNLPPQLDSEFVTHVTTDRQGAAQISIAVDSRTTKLRVNCLVGCPDANAFGVASQSFDCVSPLVVSSVNPKFCYLGETVSQIAAVSNNLNTTKIVSIKVKDPGGRQYPLTKLNVGPLDTVPVLFEHAELLPAASRIIFNSENASTSIATIDNFAHLPGVVRQLPPLKPQSSGLIEISTTEHVTLSTLTVNTSNSVLSVLASCAEELIRHEPESVDNRASRLITLLSLRKFLIEGKTSARYDAVITRDLAKLTKLPAHHDSWIEDVNAPNRDLESPSTYSYLVHALSLAFAQRLATKFAISTNLWNLVRQNDPSMDVEQKSDATAYGVFVRSQMLQYAHDKAYESFRMKDDIERFLQGKSLSSLPLETICWLSLASLQIDRKGRRIFSKSCTNALPKLILLARMQSSTNFMTRRLESSRLFWKLC